MPTTTSAFAGRTLPGRGLVRIAVAAVAVMAFVGCGESEVDLVTQVRGAGMSTLSVDSAGVSLTTETLGEEMTLDGVFDFVEKRAQLTLTGESFGIGGDTEVRYDFGDSVVMYVALPSESVATGGAGWLELDLAEALAQAGLDVDLAAIIQSQSSDPTSALQYLAGAETVTEIGTEEVRGVETTHYEVVVSYPKMVANAPEAIRADLQKLVDLYTVDTLPMEVWIDDEDRVRRFSYVIDYDTIEFPDAMDVGPLAGTTASVAAEFYDFGIPVDVILPDPADTVTVAALRAQALAAVGELGDN